MLRDIYSEHPANFCLFCPDETNSNRLGVVFEVEDRCLMDARAGIFATYEAFAMVSASMEIQPHQVAGGDIPARLAGAG
jgi:xylulose-5-phosphate/fructose-6-phosphate phosphoketolase